MSPRPAHRPVRPAGTPRVLLTVVLLALCAASVPAAATQLDVAVGAVHSLVKVRPDSTLSGEPTARVSAARNEFESFQVLLRSDRDVHALDVTVSPLVADGHRLDRDAVTIYRVDDMELRDPSSVDGHTGAWPDPLLPRVDRYFGERRAAFPFMLEAGRTRAVWVEIYVAPDTPAGAYGATVSVTADGSEVGRLPVELEVWPFTLPSTSSLPNSFGVSGLSILNGHYGQYTDDTRLHELTRLYGKAALLHRLSTHGGTMIPPRARDSGSGELYWTDYDAEVAAFLDGEVLGEEDPLPGARATSIDVRTPGELSRERQVAYWRRWVPHFEERGWTDRLFLYLMDEPQGPIHRTPFVLVNELLSRWFDEPIHDYAELAALAATAREADPRLKTMVTEQRVHALDDLIDVWVPLVNCFADKPGYPSYCEETIPRDDYPGERAPWIYQSCGSHGCDEVGGDYFTGWPTYMIDAPATGNRVLQWIAWRLRVGGELYHNTVRAYEETDPWDSVHIHGGNGDGTFFYPGTPERIGGSTHIPIESLRLKILRDGYEDYEYLHLLAELGDRAAADRAAARVAPSAYDWNPDSAVLLAVRRQLAEDILRLGSQP